MASSIIGSSNSHHGVGGGVHATGHVGGHLERASGFSSSSSRAAALASLTGGGAASVSNDPQSNRRDFLNYALSLMRAHNAEHSDSLPVIDVSAMKHIAYVFDALIYYMRSGTEAIEDASGGVTPSSSAGSNHGHSSVASVIRASAAASNMMVAASISAAAAAAAATSDQQAIMSVPSVAAVPPPPGASNMDSYNLDVGYADENENDDANDDSLLEYNNSQHASAQPVSGSAQPMELDYDDENTNQSAVSNPSLQATASAGTMTVKTDMKNVHQSKGEPEKEKQTLCCGQGSNQPQITGGQHRQGRGRRHVFFQRSESTLCLGCPPPDPFQSPLQEALPLADQPQLLQPNARREDMFGAPKQPVAGTSAGSSPANPLSVLPTRLGLASRIITDSPVSCSHTPQANFSAANFSLSTAPYQAGPSSEANFDRILTQQRSSAVPSPAAATCDTASVRSLDTTNNATLDELDEGPQDLSMGGMSSAASSDISEMILGGDDANPPPVLPGLTAHQSAGAALTSNSAARSVSFTSPKKAFMMRVGEQQSSTTGAAATGSGLHESSSHPGAPDVLVVQTNTDCDVSASAVAGLSASNINSVVGGDGGEVSANVTVETTSQIMARAVQKQQSIQQQIMNLGVPHDVLLGRWRLTLDLFGRVFVDDVGLEPGSIISELGGFPVKEAKFRREMEKLRNSKQVDLTLSKLDRDRGQLILQAFREFNTHFAQNQRRSSPNQPPLVVNRVKVTFANEPGEGSGVARGFYTALAEALLSNYNLPNLEAAQVGSISNSAGGSGGSVGASSKSMQYSLIQRLRGTRESRLGRSSLPPSTSGGTSGGHKSSRGRDIFRSLSYDARPFYLTGKKEPLCTHLSNYLEKKPMYCGQQI